LANIIYLYHMNIDLTGKNALVCGSSQGIGKASAIELALLGANITLLARSKEKLEKVLQELPNNGKQKHEILVADFSHANALKDIILAHVKERSEPYHILINNTGGPAAGLAINANESEFIQAFNNHLVCNHILVQALVEGMKSSGYGRIINIISTSVKVPLQGLGVSNTIRAAVGSWAKTLANELGQFGITVNNVLPGATATERLDTIMQNKSSKSGKDLHAIEEEMKNEIPLKRFAEPGETGAAVAFLASPAAAYISGINLPVDGGRTPSL